MDVIVYRMFCLTRFSMVHDSIKISVQSPDTNRFLIDA